MLVMMIMNDLRKVKGRIKREKTYKNCVAVGQVDRLKAISFSPAITWPQKLFVSSVNHFDVFFAKNKPFVTCRRINKENCILSEQGSGTPGCSLFEVSIPVPEQHTLFVPPHSACQYFWNGVGISDFEELDFSSSKCAWAK